MIQKVRVTLAQAAAIEHVKQHYSVESVLYYHRVNPNGWHLKESVALKNMDYGDLKAALTVGYKIEWQPKNANRYGIDFQNELVEFFEEMGDASFVTRRTLYRLHKEKKETGSEWLGFPTFNNLTVEQFAEVLGINGEVMDQQPQRGEPAVKPQYKITRKVDTEAQAKRMQQLDTDYLLTSLYDAMQRGDAKEIAKYKQQLAAMQEVRT